MNINQARQFIDDYLDGTRWLYKDVNKDTLAQHVAQIFCEAANEAYEILSDNSTDDESEV